MIKFQKITQSAWLGDLLNYYFPYDNGVFVEIGVGNIIAHDYVDNKENYKNQKWNELPNMGSNTIELLQNGWTGFYIDPVSDFVEQAYLLAPDKNKIKCLAMGCGSKNEKKIMGDGESFKSNSFNYKNMYKNCWIGKEMTISTTDECFSILNVPKVIDFISLDIEGYEEEALSTLDFEKYKIKSFFIEIDKTSLNKLNKILHNYQLIQLDQMNAFFKLNE